MLLDFTDKEPGYVITTEDVQGELDRIGYTLKERDIVLNHTGAGAYNTEERYRTDHPGMSGDATRWLIAQGVRLMGVDAITFDPPVWAMFEKQLFWEAHRVMWDEEYWHLENLMNLEQIGRPYGFQLIVAPGQVGRDDRRAGARAGDRRRRRVNRPRLRAGVRGSARQGHTSQGVQMKAVRSVVVTLVLGVGIAAGASAPALAQQNNPAQCFSKYHVVAPDHIGKLKLPAGIYQIQTNSATNYLSCSRAAYLFTGFLDDFDGVLPRPWKMEVAGTGNALFKRGRGQSFSAVYIGPRVRGRAGLPHDRRRDARHDDLPRHVPGGPQRPRRRPQAPGGRYTITTLGGRLSCSASSSLFSKFLQDPDGKLGGGWVVLPASGEFVRGTSHYGFRVKPVS